MPTEKEKMLAGERYDYRDPELTAERKRASRLCQALSLLSLDAPAEQRGELMRMLFGRPLVGLVTPPFFCDYGRNITLGNGIFFNTNCVILDVAPVTIGDNVLFGPGVHVYTAMHPLDADERRTGVEWGQPVTIGRDAWIGGGAIIGPGVTIGERTVIGAGSVVMRDVPAGVLAFGNPCRVVRELGDQDRSP